MDAFNSRIFKMELKELHRFRGRFTWTNNQDMPIRVVHDRVLVSTKCEMFPLAFVHVITKMGSDHNPLLTTTETVFRGGHNTRPCLSQLQIEISRGG